MDEQATALIEFWFAGCNDDPDSIAERIPAWFKANPAFDNELKSRFGFLAEKAAAGELDTWIDDPKSALALVLLLDQLPRNCNRNSPAAFAADPIALSVAETAIGKGFDKELAPIEAMFLYLPFEHAESLAAQQRCIALFEQLTEHVDGKHRELFAGFVDYARSHHAIIEMFGRFPHRNAVLGRTPTPEEIAWLDAGGETFGG